MGSHGPTWEDNRSSMFRIFETCAMLCQVTGCMGQAQTSTAVLLKPQAVLAVLIIQQDPV